MYVLAFFVHKTLFSGSSRILYWITISKCCSGQEKNTVKDYGSWVIKMVFVCTVIIHVDSRLNDRSDAPIDLVRFYSDEFFTFYERE